MRRLAVLIDVEQADQARVGIGDVQQLSIGRKCDAVGPRLPFRDRLQIALWREVIDAEEIQLAAVLLIAEGRVGEINMPVPPDDDIVGRVQPLAFEFRRQHFGCAVLRRPDHAAGAKLAGVQTALRVEGVAVRSFGDGRVFRYTVAWNEFMEFIRNAVGEQQERILGPDRPLGELKARGDLFDSHSGEGLRAGELHP